MLISFRTPVSPASSRWPTFRRAFLWTLAALALIWSVRTDADDLPALPDLPPAAPAEEPETPPLPTQETPKAEPIVPDVPELSLPVVPFEDLPLVPPNAVLVDEAAVADPPAPKVPQAVQTEAIQKDDLKDIPGASVTHFPKENWTVTILPNPTNPSEAMRRRYEEAYASIPYSQTEYLANPGYRHEATMEVMFNQLRPKTVVSQYEPRTIPAPAFTNYKPYMYSRGELYNRWYPSMAPFGFGMPVTPYYPAPSRFPVFY